MLDATAQLQILSHCFPRGMVIRHILTGNIGSVRSYHETTDGVQMWVLWWGDVDRGTRASYSSAIVSEVEYAGP